MGGVPAVRVYTATLRHDGRVYVGATTLTLARRRSTHKTIAPSRSSPFYQAINEFGVAAFDWRVVEEFTSPEAMHEAERRLITQLDARNPAKGFNVTSGGPGAPDQPLSDKQRAAIRANGLANAGRKHGPHSEASRAKMGAAVRRAAEEGRFGKLNPTTQAREVLALRASGLSLKRIGERYGMSASGILYFLRRQAAA